MFGDYKVNESEHSISLHIIGGSVPAWDNTNQKRFIAINGDELTYKNPTPASGGGTAVVTLKRAKSATDIINTTLSRVVGEITNLSE